MNDFANEFLALARTVAKRKNPNLSDEDLNERVRFRGTPEEERARTAAVIAKRQAVVKEPVHLTVEQICNLNDELDKLQVGFDSSYQYSDDYSVWTKHSAIHNRIKEINKILAEQSAA